MLDLDKVYIGTMYFTYDYHSPYLLNNLSKKERSDYKDALYQFKNILKDGGILFESDYLKRFVNSDNNCSYKTVLALFYRNGDEFISLVDGKVYNVSDDLFKNTISLKEVHKLTNYLPINSYFYNQIGFDYLKEVFNGLFASRKKAKIYTEDAFYPLKDYIIADVGAKEGFELIDNLRLYNDTPRQALLVKNNISNNIMMKEGIPSFYNRIVLLNNTGLQDNINYNCEENKNLYDIKYRSDLENYLEKKKIRVLNDSATPKEALLLYDKGRKTRK